MSTTTETQTPTPHDRLTCVEDLEHARHKVELGVRNAMAEVQALIALNSDAQLEKRDFKKLVRSLRFSFRYLYCLESYLEEYSQAEDEGRIHRRPAPSATKAEEPIQ